MPDTIPDWNSIVDEHAERVFRIAFRILGTVHDAEDVSQNVFSEAFKLQTNQSVKTWTGLLVRLSTLRAIDLLRSRRTDAPISDQDRISNHDPADEAVGRELAAWLRRASSNLPQQQAAVFSLSHYEQLDRNEIAAILTISPEAVSTALYKARQNLQSQIKVLDGGVK
jgi:RNA polymerase sigma-70 factor (ECF subfamily)